MALTAIVYKDVTPKRITERLKPKNVAAAAANDAIQGYIVG